MKVTGYGGADDLGVTPGQDNSSAEKNPKDLMGYWEMLQAVKYRLLCKREELSVSSYNPGVEAEMGGSLELPVQPANQGTRSEIRERVTEVATRHRPPHAHMHKHIHQHAQTCVST